VKKKIIVFYIDESLSEVEQSAVLEQLIAFGEDSGITLEYRRIPYVFPVKGGVISNEDLMAAFKKHLQHAGVDKDHHSLFIMPKADIGGTILLQMAFKAVVGSYPYVVQPWVRDDGGEPVRCKWMRVTNMNGFVARRPQDRREPSYSPPPYVIKEGVVAIDRREQSDRRTAQREAIGAGLVAKIAKPDSKSSGST
jgi:hypothetical protein